MKPGAKKGEAMKAVSDQVIQANRANSLKSTGPKDTKKTKLNAVSHGLYMKETQAQAFFGNKYDRKRAELRNFYNLDDLDPLAQLLLSSASFHLLKLEKAYKELMPEEMTGGAFWGFGKRVEDPLKSQMLFRHESRAIDVLKQLQCLSTNKENHNDNEQEH